MSIEKKDNNAIQQPKKFGLKGMQARAQELRSAPPQEVGTFPNRIGLLLDVSGSMGSSVDYKDNKQKIDWLKDAVSDFTNSCNPTDTAIAVHTFPGDDYDDYGNSSVASKGLNLTNQVFAVISFTQNLNPHGGTPMAPAMQRMLSEQPVTRCVLISDGDADHPSAAIEVAKEYKEAGIPIDCVHIGDSKGGEETLKAIAELTGGNYFKWSNVSNFAKNVKFLAPTYKAMLPYSTGEAARLLGADEVKYNG